MVDDWVIKTMYATKRRRRNAKSAKPPPGKEPIKSNPSKRHRERLNSELDHLASLLPFEQTVISKLDKLSILRLAVSYLRIKCYFQTLFHDRLIMENRLSSHLYHYPFDLNYAEGDACLQALNGFVFIVSCDGEVFFASRTVEYYLGFHQSDIIHQSVLELIHSEDREEFKRQLTWTSLLPSEKRDLTLTEALNTDNCQYMQRCFTVRFRCLLDNTSGFITLEISGRLHFLHGQSHNVDDPLPPMGLFAVCSPFGPLPSLDAAQRDLTFKTKHRMDLNISSMDVRAKMIFGYSDKELPTLKCYDLIHQDDLVYTAKGHAELVKNGTIGLLIHRWHNKSQKWIWLQSSLKVVYKIGKADSIIGTHRQLTEEEGRDLLNRRNSEYKLPFPLLEPETLLGEDEDEMILKSLPCGKNGGNHSNNNNNNNVTNNNTILSNGTTTGGSGGSVGSGKRQKSQLKDYLQASRKRKAPYREIINGYGSHHHHHHSSSHSYSGYAGVFPTAAAAALSGLQAAGSNPADFMYSPYNGAAGIFTAAGLEAVGDLYNRTANPYSNPLLDGGSQTGSTVGPASHNSVGLSSGSNAGYYGYDAYQAAAYQNAYTSSPGSLGGLDLLKSRLDPTAWSSTTDYTTGRCYSAGSTGGTGNNGNGSMMPGRGPPTPSNSNPYSHHYGNSSSSLYSRCYNPYFSGGSGGVSGTPGLTQGGMGGNGYQLDTSGVVAMNGRKIAPGSSDSGCSASSSVYSSLYPSYETLGHSVPSAYSPTRTINPLCKSKAESYSSEPAIQVPVVRSSAWHSSLQGSVDPTSGLMLGYRESLMNAG